MVRNLVAKLDMPISNVNAATGVVADGMITGVHVER